MMFWSTFSASVHCQPKVLLGATTYWETFSADWNAALEPNEPVFNSVNGFTSLCHPWASGIVQWSSENLAGVKALTPGYGTFAVKPHLTKVQAHRPLARSGQRIEIDIDGVARNYRLVVPRDTVAAEVVLPVATMGNQVPRVGDNWEIQWQQDDAQAQPLMGTVAKVEDSRFFLRLKSFLRAGKHQLSTPTWVSAGSESERMERADLAGVQDSGFGPAVWAGEIVGEDRTTQGNWRGKYGSDGYYIYGSNPVPPTPPPGPACFLGGTWTSETPGDIIVITQPTGEAGRKAWVEKRQ